MLCSSKMFWIIIYLDVFLSLSLEFCYFNKSLTEIYVYLHVSMSLKHVCMYRRYTQVSHFLS